MSDVRQPDYIIERLHGFFPGKKTVDEVDLSVYKRRVKIIRILGLGENGGATILIKDKGTLFPEDLIASRVTSRLDPTIQDKRFPNMEKILWWHWVKETGLLPGTGGDTPSNEWLKNHVSEQIQDFLFASFDEIPPNNYSPTITGDYTVTPIRFGYKCKR